MSDQAKGSNRHIVSALGVAVAATQPCRMKNVCIAGRGKKMMPPPGIKKEKSEGLGGTEISKIKMKRASSCLVLHHFFRRAASILGEENRGVQIDRRRKRRHPT